MDPRLQCGPPGGRQAGGDGGSCRRLASRQRRLRVDSEFGAAVVSDQNRAWGCTHEREGELLVERKERGRHWWRQNRPELGGGRTGRTRGRRPSLVDWLPLGASWRPLEATFVRRRARGSLNRRGKAVPRRPWISSPANRLSIARATWQRRGLADTLADELALLQGPGGERERLGRRCPWQRRTADASVPPKVLWRWRCRAPGWAVVLW